MTLASGLRVPLCSASSNGDEEVAVVTVIEAPAKMGRRDQAVALIANLPDDLSGVKVRVEFPDNAYPTTSFLDELIRGLLVDRRCAHLMLVNANLRVIEIAHLSAHDLGVADSLQIA
jgi:hypothetical protein